jgi:hypothetical protein
VVASLIGRDRRYYAIPVEARFHSVGGGLSDFVRGEVELPWLLRLLETFWYQHDGVGGEPRGLIRLLPRERYDPLVDTFAREAGQGRAEAAGALTDRVFRGIAEDRERSSWVEMTPENARSAGELHQMLPSARFVHAVRSGLDAAISMREAAWGPDDPVDCLLLWRDRFQTACAGLERVPAALRTVVHLERLSGRGQAGVIHELQAFLGTSDAEGMESWAARTVTFPRAQTGRWRQLDSSDRDLMLVLYASTIRVIRRRWPDALPDDADAIAKIVNSLPFRRRAALAIAGFGYRTGWLVRGRHYRWRRPRWRRWIAAARRSARRRS